MKLGKEKLNELLYLFHDDNIRYGLIFKLIYIYARNAGEVLKLQNREEVYFILITKKENLKILEKT